MAESFEGKKHDLRTQAEARLAKSSRQYEDLSVAEVKNLLHDYQVYQVELEIQNEELRDAQKQLETARDRFARLFNDAPVGYLTIDEYGIIGQTNQTFASMVGQSPQQLSGQAMVDCIIPADRSAFHGRFKAFFKNPAGKQLDFTLRGKPGGLAVRCVGRMETEAHGHPEKDAAQRLLLVVTDISEQVRAENTLREREQFLSAILETTQDGFWVLDAQGRVIETNESYCRMSGYPRDELLRLRIPDLEAAETPAETVARITRIIENGSETFDTQHRRKDGTLFDVEVSVSFLENEGGRFVCFCRDISERKEMTRSLQESEERYRLLSDVTMEGIVIHKHGIARDLNTALARMLGWEREELLGKNLLELIIHEDDRDIVRGNIVKDYALPYEVRGIRKGGEVFFAELEARDFEFQGEQLRVAAIRDITERRRSQETIKRQNKQLQSLLAEKDRFFSIIAHDLKSPMSGLLALSRMFVEDAENLTMKELKQVADGMHKSSENLFALLENLLQWALMQQGVMQYEPMTTNLRELVNTGMNILHSVAEQKQITLRNNIPEQLAVLVDRPMISAVIRNLLSNTLKFTNLEGAVEVSAIREKNMVRVAVQDNGIGMDQATAATIFSLDQKKVGRGTMGESGTGLGLILCKEFIEKHGGRIAVQSERGKGTTFHFTVPVGA
jgi:PAS domain S-box-containing protein